MMPPPLSRSIARRLVIGAASLATAAAVAAAAQAVATSPYVYGYGPQGLGYYLVPGAPAAVAPTAPAAVAAPARPTLTVPARQPSRSTSSGGSVGPGSRNFATGNRVPSHRPWLRSRS